MKSCLRDAGPFASAIRAWEPDGPDGRGPPQPEIIELRELSRFKSDLVAERTGLINKLKAQLRRYYPALYRALRSRGHKHARALRSVADRLPRVVCIMIETGQTFDPEKNA